MPDVAIVAACDPQLDRARAAAPRAYAEPERMLDQERLDFVDIATRPESHLALMRMAVERGIPVICQKPLAESMSQALEMKRLVEAFGVRVMVHENWRFQPWYREAKRRIDRGEIGQPVSYSFRMRQRDGLGSDAYPNQPYFRQMPRLLIYETLIHPIDTARFLFGEIQTVFATMRRVNRLIAGEDRSVVLLEHTAGTDGVVDGHRFSMPHPPGPAMGESFFEGQDGVLQVLANGDLYRGADRVWRNTIETGYKGDSVLATQRHFIDCLRAGFPFETGLNEYLPSFAAVEAAYVSAAEGRRVRLAELL
jgi:predicted dehydrogenase